MKRQMTRTSAVAIFRAGAAAVVPPAWAQSAPPRSENVQITTRAPDPAKWLSGTAANGTVRAFKCKPEACPDPTTVVFTFQKGSFTPPSARGAGETSHHRSAQDHPRRGRVARGDERSGREASKRWLRRRPSLKSYPAVVNQTKLTRNGNPSLGLCRHRRHFRRPDSNSRSNRGRQAANWRRKSLNEFVDVMDIVEVPVPVKPVPRTPRLPKTGKPVSSAADESRRPRLPRHQSRTRHGAHAEAHLRRRNRRSSGTPKRALPAGTDLVVIPGGFSYGDYLRCGAIAARSPVMDAVRAHAEQGRAHARRLQRLPDPVRGRAIARRADAQRQAALHLPRRLSARRAFRFARSPAATTPAR